jgi:hypothetical protein
MSTTRTPNICSDFSGDPGDPVRWQGVPPTGCQITADGTWPFNIGPPINLPSLVTVTIASGLAAGKYDFDVSCCSTHSVTVS